jgi:hypothetical protein
MSTEHKQRVKLALENFMRKNDPAQKTPRPKNKKPESELTVEFLKHFKQHPNFSIHRYESKAVWSPDDGRYISTQVVPGHPDLAGCDSTGRAIYLELKAPGRRATVRDNQHQFLRHKIKLNCFCLVADSIEFFSTAYLQWSNLLKTGGEVDAQEFLLKLLPTPKLKSDPENDQFSGFGF